MKMSWPAFFLKRNPLEKGMVPTVFWIWFVAFWVGIAMSFPLWMNVRPFPVIPLFSFWPVLGSPWSEIRFGWILALSLFAFWAQKPSRTLVILALLLGWTLLEDVQRLQPWCLQYTLGFVFFSVLLKTNRGKQVEDPLLPFRFMLSGIYFWAGFHKLNPEFQESVFPWISAPFQAFPQGILRILHVGGILVPWVEMGMAILLWVPKLRWVGIGLALVTHLFILASIGPLGHNWNQVVWPWNILMVVLVFLLWRKKPILPRIQKWEWTVWLSLVFYCLFPGLHTVGRGDAYLSSSLYSGRVDQGRIHLSAEAASFLPKEAMIEADQDEKGVIIYPDYWAVAILKVPIYPEARIFHRLARQISREIPTPFRKGMFSEVFVWTWDGWIVERMDLGPSGAN